MEKRNVGGVVSSLSAAARTVADSLLKSMAEELPATMARTGRKQPADGSIETEAGKHYHARGRTRSLTSVYKVRIIKLTD